MPLPALVLWLSIGVAPAQVVEGTIYDDRSGTPLQTALVRLAVPDGAVLKEIETGGDGRFVFEGLNAGEYRLAITKPNFVRLEARVISKAERHQDTAASPVFRLIRYGVLSGRLLPPRSGALTLIEKVGDSKLPRTFSANANASGDYRFFGIPPGTYLLAAALRGLVLHPRELSFLGGDDHAPVDMSIPQDRTFSIAGKLQPAGVGGSFLISMVSHEYPSLRLANTTVNASGAFRLDDIASGTYDLLASSLAAGTSSPLFGRARVSIVAQDVTDLVIPVEAGRSADIRFQGVTQDPLRVCSGDGNVTLTPLEAWLTMQPKSTPIVLNRVSRLEGLAPTRYGISAKSRSGNCTDSAIQVLDLRLSSGNAEMTMAPAGSIRGNVKRKNAPPAVAIVLRDVDPGRDSPVRVIFTTPDAGFIFENLSLGRYCVTAYSETDAMSSWAPASGCASSTVHLAAGESAELELP